MNCVIRPWILSDADDLAAALSNPKVQDMLRDGMPYPYTKKDGEDFIRFMLDFDPQTNIGFAITAEGRTIGSIGVTRRENIHFRTGELGYYIGEDFWGKGYGTSAVQQVCEYVFQHTDIIRIFAEPFVKNSPSCRILEKAGFVPEGIMRKNAVKNGEILDMKLYAMVKDD